jgi:glutaredoxin
VPSWQVVLYTRQGCHLCTAAHEQLRAWQRQQGFRLEVVDVDGDPALAAEHGLHVPVVAVNGRIRFRGRIPAVLWQRLVRGGG